MLDFFGGVARALVPDQLRSGVRRPCRYELLAQRGYAEMARHDQSAIVPARPGKPRYKAKVESAVLIVEGAPFFDCMGPAGRGDAEAEYRVGLCYRDGLGVAPRDVDAAIWFAWAAEQGHAEARAALDALYEEGRVDADVVKDFLYPDAADAYRPL